MRNTAIEKLDVNETAFFLRELEFIKARSFDVLKAPLTARELFPISYEADPGATAITYSSYDTVGMAKVVANYADDLPIAEVKGVQNTQLVRELGAAYQYNIKEIRKSQMSGKGLEQRKANAAVRAIEMTLNKLAFHGGEGVQGFLNNNNIPVASGHDWDTATPAEIYADMQLGVTSIIDNSNGVHTPNEIWLPAGRYAKVMSERMAEGTDTTIGQFAQMNLNVTIKQCPNLKGTGAGDTDRMVICENNGDNFTLEIPAELDFLPPQERNLSYIINGLLSTGGVIVYYPMAAMFIDGL